MITIEQKSSSITAALPRGEEAEVNGVNAATVQAADAAITPARRTAVASKIFAGRYPMMQTTSKSVMVTSLLARFHRVSRSSLVESCAICRVPCS